MVDLHTHSTVSDGSDRPDRIPELAADAGCSAVALTDHDRLDGVTAAAIRAAELGIDFVPGCEISCEIQPGTMHLLVYFVTARPGPLQDELVRLQQARIERNRRLVRRLADLGLPVSLDELEAEARGAGVGRPHVAAVLVRKGLASSIQEAFDRFLAKGRPGYVDKERPLPAEAIRLALASGGIPVLAHPLSLGLQAAALDRGVAELVEFGLVGLEALYGRYTAEERNALAEMAQEHDLVATGGSDHHGTYKPDLQVGVGRGDLCVNDEVLDGLRHRLSG